MPNKGGKDTGNHPGRQVGPQAFGRNFGGQQPSMFGQSNYVSPWSHGADVSGPAQPSTASNAYSQNPNSNGPLPYNNPEDPTATDVTAGPIPNRPRPPSRRL